MRRFALISIWLFFSLSTALAAVPVAERSALVALYNGIDLNDNNLVGSIPNTLGNLSKLNDLEMSDNQLSGSIPSDLDKLTKLRLLYL